MRHAVVTPIESHFLRLALLAWLTLPDYFGGRSRGAAIALTVAVQLFFFLTRRGWFQTWGSKIIVGVVVTLLGFNDSVWRQLVHVMGLEFVLFAVPAVCDVSVPFLAISMAWFLFGGDFTLPLVLGAWEWFAKSRFIVCSALGVPLCRLKKLDGIPEHIRECVQRKTVVTGAPYTQNRVRGDFRAGTVWAIERFGFSSKVESSWDAFCPTQRSGGYSVLDPGDVVWTWHATNKFFVTSIAAGGFKLGPPALGRWYGHGIYQSVMADVAAHYARVYGAKNAALVVLSRTKVGQVDRLKEMQKNQDLSEGTDTWVVLHANKNRAGQPGNNGVGSDVRAELSWFNPKRMFWSVKGYGDITGEEIISRDPAQILPEYIVLLSWGKK